ncbi:MAG: hypothetical protein ACYTHK_03130 [Planctomycetota bacterium]|jgi:hypothetical protein
MKQLTLLFVLGLMGPACSTTAQWYNELAAYRDGRTPTHAAGEPDLRAEQEKMAASAAQGVGRVVAEIALLSAFALLAAAAG